MGAKNPFITHISSHRALFISRRPEAPECRRMVRAPFWETVAGKWNAIDWSENAGRNSARGRAKGSEWGSSKGTSDTRHHLQNCEKLVNFVRGLCFCVCVCVCLCSCGDRRHHSEWKRRENRRQTKKKNVLLEMTEHFKVTAISKNHRDEPLQHRLCI